MLAAAAPGAFAACNVLTGADDLRSLEESMLLAAFEGVPQKKISRSTLETCATVTDLLSVATDGLVFPSKGEARKMIQAGGVSVNKTKLQDANAKPEFSLLRNKYLIAQKGKKNYYLIIVE